MNHKILIILFVLSGSLSFFSCKKYEEGGKKSRAKTNLFADGSWILSTYLINGNDSLRTVFPFTTSSKEFNFFKETPASDGHHLIVNKDYSVRFSFINARKEIEINGISVSCQCYHSVCNKNIFNPENNLGKIKWEILKLDADEFLLKADLANYYYLKFNKL